MDDRREVRRIPKCEVSKPQQDAEYILRRNAVGMIRALRDMYPDEFAKIAEETKPHPRHPETLVKFDL